MTRGSALKEALDALITCRTVAFSTPGVILRAPLQRRTRGPVDLAIIGDDPLPPQLRPAALLHRYDASLPNLDLAEDSAFWRPGLCLGLTENRLPGAETGAFLVSQRPALADYLLAEAPHHDIPLVGAVATGQHRPQLWRDLVLAALDHPRVELVILALQHRVDIDDLALCSRHAGPTPILLHLTDEARDLRAAKLGALPVTPHLDALAPALGIATFPTPAQLFEGARHLLAGVRRRFGTVLPLVGHPHEIPLLARSLDLAGLRISRDTRALRDAKLDVEGPFVVAPTRQHLLSRALRRARPLEVDALICAGHVPRALDVTPPQLVIGPAAKATPPARQVDETALAALGCLLAAHPPSVESASAPLGTLALPSQTHVAEAVSKDLARRHGVTVIPERVVSSATAAAKAASDLDGPLTLRPYGPDLDSLDGDLRPLLTRSDLTSTASIRQAFHDVLFACAERLDGEPIEGVVVAETPPPGLTLDSLLLFPDGLPLVRLALSAAPTAPPRSFSWLRLPASKDEHATMAHDLVAPHGAPPGRAHHHLDARAMRAELRRLLARLQTLALEVAATLRWLHLGPIRLPFDGAPAILIAARGERH